VGELVLLNIILYCGNIFCKYLVDFDAVSLVSWIAIMTDGTSRKACPLCSTPV
jgi:hypothetical protein